MRSFDHIPLTVGNTCIDTISKVKDLGVIVDKHLTMIPNVNQIVRSAFLKIREISFYRKFLSSDVAKTLIHAYVTSRVDYCNSLLYGLPNNVLCKLQSVINTAARLVTFTKKFDHITPVLKELHWLPIQQRIKFKMLLLVFKSLNDLAPDYMRNKLTLKQDNGLRSSNQNLLVVPRSRLKTY